jgi:osmotically-inducible protein OsmY
MANRYSGQDYDRRYRDERSPERTRYGLGDEGQRYDTESRWRGEYGGTSGPGRGYSNESWEDTRDYSGRREGRYGGRARGYDTERTYGDTPSGYSPRYSYPSDYPSREISDYESGRGYNYGRGRFGTGGGYEYDERGRYGSPGDRGWWDRASDEVASWFGDEEAERRRRMDEQREQFRGRGPKGYRRSDERIKEDVNDRLSDGYLDASEIEVNVQNAEVTLTGTVNSRRDKRLAEDLAESVSGVTNVENRLRVKQAGSEMYGRTGTSETTTPSSSSAAAGSGRTRT